MRYDTLLRPVPISKSCFVAWIWPWCAARWSSEQPKASRLTEGRCCRVSLGVGTNPMKDHWVAGAPAPPSVPLTRAWHSKLKLSGFGLRMAALDFLPLPFFSRLICCFRHLTKAARICALSCKSETTIVFRGHFLFKHSRLGLRLNLGSQHVTTKLL